MNLHVNREQLPDTITAVVRKTIEMDLPWDCPAA